MKKFLSILMVLMLAVLPAMAEQTDIKAERQVITMEMTSSLLEGFSCKMEEDIQDGEYAHALIKLFLNGEELMSEGVMLDEAAKQLFISYPAMFENVLVFDEEDLKKVINAVSDALVETLNELKNDPEFISTMVVLLDAMAEEINQAITEAEAEAAQQAVIEAVLETLNYDNLAKEMKDIFTPVKTVYTSEDGTTLTDYSYTLDQSVVDRLIDAVEAFFAENAKALEGLVPDAATMAEFRAIIDMWIAGFSISGSVGMDSNNNLTYCNLKINAKEEDDTVTIALTATDVKDGDKENVLLAFDIIVNDESVGISILVEEAEKGAVVRVMANANEKATELGRVEVKAENDNDISIRFVLGSGEKEVELALISIHVETLEPNILYFEGGETVMPLKMSDEDLDKFALDALSRLEAWSTETSAKIEAAVESIANKITLE